MGLYSVNWILEIYTYVMERFQQYPVFGKGEKDMLRIETEKRKFVLKTNEQESENLFHELLCKLFSLEQKENSPDLDEKDTEDTKQRETVWDTAQKYSGALYIKCEHCGAEKGWFAVSPTNKHKCRECGETTILKQEHMHPMYLSCECGWHADDMTNLAVQMADIPCPVCGAPIAIEWNDKKRHYQRM